MLNNKKKYIILIQNVSQHGVKTVNLKLLIKLNPIIVQTL